MNTPPIWHKNNYEFWLVVCIAISIAFALVYTTLRAQML